MIPQACMHVCDPNFSCTGQVGQSEVVQEVQTDLKSIFETPYNEVKCVLSIKESNFNGNMGQNFLICLQSGTRGLTAKRPFITTSQSDSLR